MECEFPCAGVGGAARRLRMVSGAFLGRSFCRAFVGFSRNLGGCFRLAFVKLGLLLFEELGGASEPIECCLVAIWSPFGHHLLTMRVPLGCHWFADWLQPLVFTAKPYVQRAFRANRTHGLVWELQFPTGGFQHAGPRRGSSLGAQTLGVQTRGFNVLARPADYFSFSVVGTYGCSRF